MFFPEPPTWNRRLSELTLLVARKPLIAGLFGTSISVAVSVLMVAVLLSARHHEIANAIASSANITSSLSREIGRNFELYDLSLQAVAEGAADPRVGALPPDMRRRVLFDRSTAARFVSGVFVIDSSGQMTLGRDDEAKLVNVADRDYFLAQRSGLARGLFISRPYASRARGSAPSLALSRRITLPDGRFGGVASLAVNLEYFELMLKSLSTGERGASIILQTDGTVVARNPSLKSDEPQSVSHSPTFARMLASAQGYYVARSPVDGVQRIYSFARVPGTNLIAVFAPSYDDLLAGWRRRSWAIGILALSLSGAFATVVWALVFGLRYRIALQAQLDRIADTDALTGVLNRRALKRSLEVLSVRHRQACSPFSVLFIDADNFKAYNDRYGHDAGDEALRLIAACLQSQSRSGIDVVTRYGGEEFVVVLPGADLHTALEVAERMRADVEYASTRVGSSVIAALTVSIGCSVARPGKSATTQAVLRAADRALYLAKHRGRNQVCGASASMYGSADSYPADSHEDDQQGATRVAPQTTA